MGTIIGDKVLHLGIKSGGQQPESLLSRATGFGSGDRLTGMGAYSLGVNSLRIYNLGLSVYDLGINSLAWEPAILESTA